MKYIGLKKTYHVFLLTILIVLILSVRTAYAAVAGYNIYRSQTSGGPYAKVNLEPVPSVSYQDISLVNGTVYYYVITSVDTAGNESGYSAEVFAQPLPVIGVDVSPDVWDIGSKPVSSVTTMQNSEKITVFNVGSSAISYSLQVVNPLGWQASQTIPDYNTYLLNAGFSVNIGNIFWNTSNHALSTESVLCTDTKFAGDQTGVNVTSGQERTLWLQFKAPVATPIITEQNIEVIINAQTP